MRECLSDFAIDDRELHGRGGGEAERHLAGCERCGARLAERAARVTAFDRTLGEPVWQVVLARRRAVAAGRRRLVVWRSLTLVGAAASLLAVAIARIPARDGARYVAAKGGLPGASVAPAEIVCRRGGQTFVLGAGDPVAAGDRLRFRPLAIGPEARFIQVGSVDGTGAYSSFYPAAAPGNGDVDGAAVSVALPAAGAPLDGSVVLDDAPGPERIFFVLSAAPLAARDVRAAAEAHAARGDAVDRIGGARVVSAWVVLEKRRAPGVAR